MPDNHLSETEPYRNRKPRDPHHHGMRKQWQPIQWMHNQYQTKKWENATSQKNCFNSYYMLILHSIKYFKNYSIQKKTVDKTSEHHFNSQRIQDKIWNANRFSWLPASHTGNKSIFIKLPCVSAHGSFYTFWKFERLTKIRLELRGQRRTSTLRHQTGGVFILSWIQNKAQYSGRQSDKTTLCVLPWIQNKAQYNKIFHTG